MLIVCCPSKSSLTTDELWNLADCHFSLSFFTIFWFLMYCFYVCLVLLSSSYSLTPLSCACDSKDLNSAHQSFARLHSAFFGIPHMHSIVRLLGSRSLPWLIRALLDHVSNKVCLILLKLFFIPPLSHKNTGISIYGKLS